MLYHLESTFKHTNEPTFKYSQHPRAIDCIYLRYVDNFQGGSHLLGLNTGKTIKRRTISQVPITKNGIELVHKLAGTDGIQEGLKITNKKNVILFDSSWIAGVDYENNSYEEEEDESIQERNKMNPNEIYKTRHNIIISENTGVDNNINAENFVYKDEESSNPAESAESEESESAKSEEYESKSEDLQEVLERAQRTRSGRIARPPSKLNINQCHLITQGYERTEYLIETGEK